MSDFCLSSSDIAECISDLIARNKLWLHKKVNLHFIINHEAGCFTNKKLSEKYQQIFLKAKEDALKTKQCVSDIKYKIYETEYKGHAIEFTKSIINKLSEIKLDIKTLKSQIENIIVTAGGDGTCLEVQSTLYNENLKAEIENKNKQKIINKLAILRLPLGTGNDGTDGHTIQETIQMLKNGLVYSNSKVLAAYTENDPEEELIIKSHKFISKYCDIKAKSPWYSFNIASVGLDAFVNFVTNLVKSKFPGNLYHLCVPISGLFYSRIFKTGNTKIELFANKEDEQPSNTFEGKIYLTAMGASGYRTYGGGQKVLPNFNNVCIAEKVSLLRLIKDNHKFVDGTHINSDIGNMFCADKIKIYHDQPLMLQCDGECYLLCKNHFPLIIEKRDSGFKTLKTID